MSCQLTLVDCDLCNPVRCVACDLCNPVRCIDCDLCNPVRCIDCDLCNPVQCIACNATYLVCLQRLKPVDSEYLEGREYSSSLIKSGSYGDVCRIRDNNTGFECAAKKVGVCVEGRFKHWVCPCSMNMYVCVCVCVCLSSCISLMSQGLP